MPNSRTAYQKQYALKNKTKLREYKSSWKTAHNQAVNILPKVKTISKELSRLMKNVKVNNKNS